MNQDKRQKPTTVKITIQIDGEKPEVHECNDYILAMSRDGEEGSQVSVGSTKEAMQSMLINLLFSVASSELAIAWQVIGHVTTELMMLAAREQEINKKLQKSIKNKDELVS